MKKVKKNIQYLTDQEVKKIKSVLTDKENSLTLRNKAIGCLLVYTGLRRSDIASMKLDSIEWDKYLINVTQQKTDNEVELPLRSIVANAIGDYIVGERPDIECDYLFISYNKPLRQLSPHDIKAIANKIMDVANIRTNRKDRRGCHIFRHHAATKMIGSGISSSVVSAVLGHVDPNSIDTYLSADFVHLKQCALSIKAFPIAKEVFDDESI